MKSGMKIGMVYPQTELGGDPGAVRALGDAAVDLGYDYLLAYDHVLGAEHADRDPKLWGPYTENDPFHDPFVLFAYLAARHETLEFASGVIILPQRQTVLVAKQAADLDLLSGERFRLGIGVGWNWVEYDALGQDFSTRGRRANEQIEFMRRLWSEPTFEWQGEFDRIDRAGLVPRPNRAIPIWVGGFSDPAYRRALRHGDGFMFGGDGKRVFAAYERLAELAETEGRDLAGFGLEFVRLRGGDGDTIADEARRWADVGGSHFSIASMGLDYSGLDDHLAHFERAIAALD